jgi:hypothetical protein
MENDVVIEQKKSCRYCGESIKSIALVCRYCGRNIKSTTAISKLNTLALIVCLILLLASATSYYSPYWTLQQIRAAVEQKDEDALESLVDFKSLRDGLKSDFTAYETSQIGDELRKDGIFGAMGTALGSTVVNSFIDNLVSPPVFIRIMTGESPLEIAKNEEDQKNPTPVSSGGMYSYQYTANAHLLIIGSYKTLDRFRAFASKANLNIELNLGRTGPFSWKLTHIHFLPSTVSVTSTKQIVRFDEIYDDGFAFAKKAGIKSGDQIVAINGQKVDTIEEACALVVLHKNGSIKLDLIRDNKSLVVETKVGSGGEIDASYCPEINGQITSSSPNLIEYNGNKYGAVNYPSKTLDPDNVRDDNFVLLRSGSRIKITGISCYRKVDERDEHNCKYEYISTGCAHNYATVMWVPKIEIIDGGILCYKNRRPNPNFLAMPVMIDIPYMNCSSESATAKLINLNQMQYIVKAKNYHDIVKILHSEGLKEFETSFGNKKSIVYKWQNPNGSYLACIFENGLLVDWFPFLLTNEIQTQIPDMSLQAPVNSSTDTDWKHTDWD